MTPTRDLDTRLTPLADLHPHPRNPRNGDTTAIADSLTANGQYVPIVATRDGTVIVGNHRYAAALELGWTQMWVVHLDLDADDPEALRIMAADNRTSDLGRYDDQALLDLLRGLPTTEGTGYSDADVADLAAILEFASRTPGTTEAGYSGANLHGEGIVPDKGLKGVADDYAAKATRSVILDYALTEYDAVMELLAACRRLADVDNNSAVVLRALEAYAGREWLDPATGDHLGEQIPPATFVAPEA